MEHQEFPKLLYKGGFIGAEYVIVQNEAEEADAEGYEVANLELAEESQEPAKRKPGRPKKVD